MKMLLLFITFLSSIFLKEDASNINTASKCSLYMNVKSKHLSTYKCPTCRGYGTVEKACCGGEDTKTVTCSSCSGDGRIYAKIPEPLYSFYKNFTPGFYLFLAKAYVRDDGEHEWTEPADIGLRVRGGKQFNINYFAGRLFGPIYNGIDGDFSLKYEWDDYCTVYYDYFPLMKLDNYGYRYIIIEATEGDDAPFFQGGDDNVYSLKLDISNYKNCKEDIQKFEGSCDIPGQCATFWLSVRYCESQDCGDFWSY